MVVVVVVAVAPRGNKGGVETCGCMFVCVCVCVARLTYFTSLLAPLSFFTNFARSFVLPPPPFFLSPCECR